VQETSHRNHQIVQARRSSRSRRAASTSLGIQGFTVSEVKGFCCQEGHTEIYRGAEYSVSFLAKVKVEAAIADDLLDLARAVRIRTGEQGGEAL
jgi:nitrogen regulatory protein P-II 2